MRMDESQSRRLALRDRVLPALPTILGPDPTELLDAALGPGGGRVHSARLSQASWWPGRSLSAVFQARVSSGPGKKVWDQSFVMATGTSIPARVLELEGADGAPPPGEAEEEPEEGDVRT